MLWDVALEIIKQGVYAFFLFLIGLLSRPVYLDFRRKRSGFGIVFNSRTGEPEDTAVIRLRDYHGQIVRTAVSDKQGRYRVAVPKGEYTVEVAKAGFVFPSAALKNKTNPFFDNLLPSARIIVKDYGTITKNIPIDPAQPGKGPSVFSMRMGLSKGLQHSLAFFGTLVAFAIVLMQKTNWLAWAIFAVYFLVMVRRMLSYRPAKPPYGTVKDAATGQPMQQVVVRLIEQKFNKVLDTQVTSPQGRYAFVVKPGTYRIMIEKKGYKKIIVNYPNIKQDGYLLARDVSMKRAV